MRSVRYDPSVTLGALIQLVVLVVALVGGCVRMEQRFTTMELKVDTLWARAERAGSVR